MATKTKKSPQPPAEPVPLPTDAEIAGRLRDLVLEERAKFDTIKSQFVARLESGPTFAIEGLGVAVVEQEAEARTWEIVEQWLSGEHPSVRLADRLATILDSVSAHQARILSSQTWEANSTSAFANVARMHGTSGRARALEMIAIHVRVAMMQIEGRAKTEAE